MPRCRYCQTIYKPARPMQPGRVCNSIECQAKHAEEIIAIQRKKRAQAERIAAREDRKVVRAKLEDMKPLSYFADKAQKAVNAFVRERDKNEPCISCGRFHDGAYDAGHYRSRGAAPALRFNLDNINKQCVPCNQHKSGNAIEYRIRLVKKIGIEHVEWLEQEHPAPHWKREDYERIEKEAKEMLKKLKEAGK